MTAEDARDLTRRAMSEDAAAVRLALDLWLEAIRQAAADRRRSVRDYELRRLRTPISASAQKAALDVLTSKQFAVRIVPEGRNETSVEVSW